MRGTPENTRNNQSQNTLNPGIAEECITQVSTKTEGRVTWKLSREISRTESRNLGAFCKLVEFLLNPHVRTCCVAVTETSRNNNSKNRESAGERSLVDPCPKMVFFACQTSNLKDSEQDETHHMVTRVQEEIPYFSPGTSPGKQKKARSTSQPQFRSENTPATIEADQILLPLQQLATDSNSASFNNKINRISILPKSLTMTMPTFDGKSEKL